MGFVSKNTAESSTFFRECAPQKTVASFDYGKVMSVDFFVMISVPLIFNLTTRSRG